MGKYIFITYCQLDGSYPKSETLNIQNNPPKPTISVLYGSLPAGSLIGISVLCYSYSLSAHLKTSSF